MTKRATIKDIAQAANVSIATVSRVLNHNPLVTPETEKKVLKAAHSLNYIPNSSAQSLKTNQTKTIGFVISDLASEALTVAARNAGNVLVQYGYNMILCNSENNPERELDYLRMLMSKNIDGLVLNTTGWNADVLAEINQQVPVVLFNRKVEDPRIRCDLIDANNRNGSYALTKKLLEKGHRRILFISGPKRLSNARERFQGFSDAMREAGIDTDQAYPYITEGEFCHETGAEAVDHLLTMAEPPTAVFASNVTICEGFLLRAKEVGLVIPDEISLASYDGITNYELMKIRPASAVCNTPKMGEQIGRSIIERIHDPELESRFFIFDPRLEEGNSIAPPTSSLAERLRRKE